MPIHADNKEPHGDALSRRRKRRPTLDNTVFGDYLNICGPPAIHIERASRFTRMAVVLVLLLAVRSGNGAEPADLGDVASGASVAAGDNALARNVGPTVKLSYSKEALDTNSISSFMYFVPLIARTLVERQTSAGNDQKVSVISYEREIGAKSFHVACEFEIRGTGFHKDTFDPAGAIATRIGELAKDEPITHALDYITFEGEGLGRIEVEGTISGSVETVTEVDLQFNVGGRKSPVTIGLYDIKPMDGQYTYEHRSNEVVARVNTLAFKKTDTSPRMGVTVASITKAAASDGFFARIKGAIANLFIKPPKISKLGNDTMLNFGLAIRKQEPEFTFPTATNIKEDKTVTATPPER